MNAYQKLTNFSGSLYKEPDPSYRGIEYDFEVPNNLVIGSPGGVDSVRHHYTKGFYGRGNTSSDVYAGQQSRYIDGKYGNLYNVGHSAAQAQGFYGDAPDPKFWMNQPSFPVDNPTFNSKETFIGETPIEIPLEDIPIEYVPEELKKKLNHNHMCRHHFP